MPSGGTIQNLTIPAINFTMAGFRSGGFGLRAQSALELQSFEPEHVTEYELGLKTNSRLGGGRLRSSLALFYQDYKNVQKQNPVLVNGVVATIVTNTAAQENYGAEAEVGMNFDNGVYANLYRLQFAKEESH